MAILANVDLQRPLTDHPLWNGLRGLWLPVAETARGSTLYDLSPRPHHGTMVGMTWEAVDGRLGLNGTSNSTYTSIGSIGLTRSAGEPYTMIGVARTRGASGTHQVIIGTRNGSSAGDLDKLSFSTSLLVTFEYDPTGGGAIATGTYANTDQWYTLIGTYDGSIIRLYQDGINTGSSVSSTAAITADDYAIGRRSDDASEYLKGTCALAAVYDRAFTAAEVRTFYQQSITGYPDLIRRVPTRRVFYMSPAGDVNYPATVLNATATIEGTSGIQENRTLELTL